MRRWIGLLALLCLSCDTTPSGPDQQRDLHVKNVVAIDSAGRVLVEIEEEPHAAIWDNGEFTLLPKPADATIDYVTDFNNAGQVIGMLSSGVPFLWQAPATRMQELRAVDGNRYYPSALNDDGVIVGTVILSFRQPRFGEGNPPRTAFRWTHARGFEVLTPSSIMDPGLEPWAGATDINNAGQIVGWYLRGASLYVRGFSYRDGIGWSRVATGLDGETQPNAVNNDGVVTGWNQDSINTRAFAWGRLTPMSYLLGGADYSCAVAINDGGDIVGQTIGIRFSPPRPFLRRADGTAIDIPIPQGASGHAADINNRGQVLGYWDDGTERHFFVWSTNGGFVQIGKTSTWRAGVPQCLIP